MSLRYHPFVTQRDRDEAVDRIMAAFHDAYPSAVAARHEPSEPSALLSLSSDALPLRAGGMSSLSRAQESQPPRLLLGERLLLISLAIVTVLVVGGNIWQHWR